MQDYVWNWALMLRGEQRLSVGAKGTGENFLIRGLIMRGAFCAVHIGAYFHGGKAAGA